MASEEQDLIPAWLFIRRELIHPGQNCAGKYSCINTKGTVLEPTTSQISPWLCSQTTVGSHEP